METYRQTSEVFGDFGSLWVRDVWPLAWDDLSWLADGDSIFARLPKTLSLNANLKGLQCGFQKLDAAVVTWEEGGVAGSDCVLRNSGFGKRHRLPIEMATDEARDIRFKPV